jgi:hypothetical protein
MSRPWSSERVREECRAINRDGGTEMVDDREKNRGPPSSMVAAHTCVACFAPSSCSTSVVSRSPPCAGTHDERRAAAEASDSNKGAAEEGRSSCDGDAIVMEETDDDGEAGGKGRARTLVGLLPNMRVLFLLSKAGVMAPLREGGRGEGEGNAQKR